MSKIADTEANATSLDSLINNDGLVATLRNGPKPSWSYLVNEIRKSRGFRVVGSFSDGFTYELFNDVGIDSEGSSWIYTGSGAPSKIVAAGTVPTAGDYEKVAYSNAENVQASNGSTVQSFIDSFTLKIFQSPTDGGLTEIQTRTVNANEVYEVRKTSDNSLATIYSDAAGKTEIVQNGTSNVSGSDGVVSFYIKSGNYVITVGSEIGVINVENPLEYSYSQRSMLAEELKKLRDKEQITFTWYGDSNSVRENKSVQVAFRGALQGAYGDSYILPNIDRATSGFSAKISFETYTSNHSGNISIINFGTNDATTQAGYPLAGNIEEYLHWMERLIIREINWGHPVVLVTPLPVRFDKAFETYTYSSPSDPFPTFKRIDAYQMGNALKYLANKYSIPVIDSVEAMANYKDEMFATSTQSINVGTSFGDPVHLDAGYGNAWGVKIAAAFIGDLVMRPVKVKDGDMLNVTHGSSPVIINSTRDPDDIYEYYSDSSEVSFATGDDFVGNRCLQIITGERVTFSFYTDADNIVVIPTYLLFSNSNALVFLDSRVVQPRVKLDNDLSGGLSSNTEYNQISTASSAIVNRPHGFDTINTRDESNNFLYISSKGWHTITILCNSGTVAVSGLNFISEKSFNESRKSKAGTTKQLAASGGLSGELFIIEDGSSYICSAVNAGSGAQKTTAIICSDGSGSNIDVNTLNSVACQFVIDGDKLKVQNDSSFSNTYKWSIRKI